MEAHLEKAVDEAMRLLKLPFKSVSDAADVADTLAAEVLRLRARLAKYERVIEAAGDILAGNPEIFIGQSALQDAVDALEGEK